MVKVKKDNYVRIETTFSKDNEREMELFDFALEQSKLFGKSKYIKMLILEDFNKQKSSK